MVWWRDSATLMVRQCEILKYAVPSHPTERTFFFVAAIKGNRDMGDLQHKAGYCPLPE